MKSFVIFALISILTSSFITAENRPNILFIAIDDLKPDLGCYGSKIVHSPNIDRLAASGTTFLNSHCNQAICGPSRASLMSGLRPDRSGVHDLQTKQREANPNTLTIPEYFRLSGYTTAGTGKIYDPRCVDRFSDKPSWSIPFAMDSLQYNPNFPKPVTHYQSDKHHAVAKDLKTKGIKSYNALMKELTKRKLFHAYECLDLPDDAYTDGAIANQAVVSIQNLANKKQPFFLAVGFKKPHLPFNAPKKYWDLYERSSLPIAEFAKPAEGAPDIAYHTSGELAKYGGIPKSTAEQQALIHGYYACISYIDHQIGKLLTALDQAQVTNNTIVILWGDHGWHLGDHGLWCKHSNYEQATRSPLILSGPGVQSGLKTNAATEFTDIFPSLCDLASLPTPQNLDGISFEPVLSGKSENVRKFAMGQYPRGPNMGYALRSKKFRYVAWKFHKDKGTPPTELGQIKAEELYDYFIDPLERKNLAKDPKYQKQITSMRSALDLMLKDQHKRISKDKIKSENPTKQKTSSLKNEQLKSPNIVFFITDDQFKHHMNFMPEGKGKNLTPHTDNLVNESTVMDAQYVTSPVCTPSRFACLSGLYPSRSKAKLFLQRQSRLGGQASVEWNTFIHITRQKSFDLHK